jgi:uncharacterized membrane protein
MTQVSNAEPLIEANERDYHDSGIASTVAIAKHPLHPVIVTFPIAFLVGALGTDLGFWLTHDSFWPRASFWLIGAGLVSGVLAALIGMADFLKIRRVRERQAGWVHMFGNIAALIATLINFVLRWDNAVNAVIPIGLLLSIAVSALLGITGWFGGELVYRHKIAVVGNSSPDTP